MEMMKLRFAFAHFVIVLLSLLPLSEENGAKAKFRVAQAKYKKK
jgi:hypothetical protein